MLCIPLLLIVWLVMVCAYGVGLFGLVWCAVLAGLWYVAGGVGPLLRALVCGLPLFCFICCSVCWVVLVWLFDVRVGWWFDFLVVGVITAVGFAFCRFVAYGLSFLLGLIVYCGCLVVNSVGITRYVLVVRVGVLVDLLPGFVGCLYLGVVLIAFRDALVY